MKSNIYWEDLTDEVKEGLARDRKTTPEKMFRDNNFKTMPIAEADF
jgi:hypothetical protein